MNVHLYFSHLLSDLGAIWCKRLGNNVVEHHELYKNWCREDHTLLLGISEVTFMCLPPPFAVSPHPPPLLHFDSSPDHGAYHCGCNSNYHYCTFQKLHVLLLFFLYFLSFFLLSTPFPRNISPEDIVWQDQEV